MGHGSGHWCSVGRIKAREEGPVPCRFPEVCNGMERWSVLNNRRSAMEAVLCMPIICLSETREEVFTSKMELCTENSAFGHAPYVRNRWRIFEWVCHHVLVSDCNQTPTGTS